MATSLAYIREVTIYFTTERHNPVHSVHLHVRRTAPCGLPLLADITKDHRQFIPQESRLGVLLGKQFKKILGEGDSEEKGYYNASKCRKLAINRHGVMSQKT